MSSPHDITKATSAQSVPGASAAEATSGPSYHGSYFDEQENHLLNVNNARQKLASNGSASSAPGPGILTNGTASDIEMRWWCILKT
ncbi:GH22632 [Drosophila grimshawi]|uniref:GH22632 n=1 Tax=Drosophila grimshawi TaxID=7222 RepID=B4JVP0_DROGR|nr:GH22632 [Drosophila grimshawi]